MRGMRVAFITVCTTMFGSDCVYAQQRSWSEYFSRSRDWGAGAPNPNTCGDAPSLNQVVAFDAALARREPAANCLHRYNWKPSDYVIGRMKANRELGNGATFNFCNADLSNLDLRGVKIERSDLRSVDLSGSNLTASTLSESDLHGADLTNTILDASGMSNVNASRANFDGTSLRHAYVSNSLFYQSSFNKANLSAGNFDNSVFDLSKFSEVNFRQASIIAAKLDNVTVHNTDFSKAKMQLSSLKGSVIRYSDFSGALLSGVHFVSTDLSRSKFSKTDLAEAKLDFACLYNSDFSSANLQQSSLFYASINMTDLTDARLLFSDLTGALYAPLSAPPSPVVAGIRGIESAVFPPGREIGLVQLRDLIQKAGLRDLERAATYAIESGRTSYALTAHRYSNGGFENLEEKLNAYFRYIFFDITSGYGLYPGRSLWIILVIWVSLAPVYYIPIRFGLNKPRVHAGVYKIIPTDKVIQGVMHKAKPNGVVEVVLLKETGIAAAARALQFSLFSAFHIGWRDFNVGSWLSRIQSEEYTLKGTGWVRTLSGIQSLVSVYLLSVWILSYFGRPFQ